MKTQAWFAVLLVSFVTAGCCPAFIQHCREQLLKEQLYTMRNALDQFAQEKGASPQSLYDLVNQGYLRDIPVDPCTHSRETWNIVRDESTVNPEHGITDIHSGCTKVSSEGTPYNQW